MPSPTFRPATVDDSEALSALVNSAYRGESSKKGWTTEADLLGGQRTDAALLREMVGAPGSLVLVMVEATEIVGCVSLVRKPDRAYLGMLTVRPTLQGGGVGKRLLEESERWVAREWKVSVVEMTVIRQRTELIAWYERRGYRDTGRREPFPYDEPRFGIPRRADLEFVVLEKQLGR